MRTERAVRWMVWSVSSFVCLGASADVVYVRADLSSGLNDGSSWANAYRGSEGLVAALAQATPGDEIWVGRGTYTPAGPGGSREASFVMPSGVRLVGGFLGYESNRNLRNMVLNRSILSGDLDGDDAVNNVRDDNAAHVLRVADASAGTIIDGMTIRGGEARDYSSSNQVQRREGGGLLVTNSTLEIISTMIEDNHADSAGGGMCVVGGSVSVSYSLVMENVSPGLGAGFAATGGAVLNLQGVSMVRNVGGSGAGIFSGPVRLVSDQTATLRARYVLFRDHDARIGATAGAGILSYGPLEVVGCTFDRNQANGGGGVMIVAGDARIEDSKFVANKANGDLGDAIHIRGEVDAPGDPAWPTVEVVNTQITGHPFVGFPRADGSPVFVSKGSLRLVNCTVASNGGSRSAGALVLIEGDMTVDNSIVWGNTGVRGGGQDAAFFVSSSLPTTLSVNRSLIQGWDGTLPGVGSFDGHPRFVDADGFDDLVGTMDDDFSLLSDSDAIDQGDLSLVPEGVTLDLARLDRFRQNAMVPDAVAGGGNPVDCGAFEYQRLCEAEFNADGFLDFFDFDAFVEVFELGVYGGASADFNGDGFVDFFDYDAFVAAFEAGC
jgi:hypothetical protein